MYLSYILINTGGNPDRPRPGKLWLRNIYNVHQRLCMGFPNNEQIAADPDFLFRIENDVGDNESRTVICVQSALEPSWEYAFQNARALVVAIGNTVEYNPRFADGDLLRFRININLSKKNSKKDKSGRLRTEQERKKRVAFIWGKNEIDNLNDGKGLMRDEEIRKWFVQKVENGHLGFEVNDFEVTNLGWRYGWKYFKKNGNTDEFEDKPHRLKFRSALLTGVLKVTNEKAFLETIKKGIGSAKAFGFGLLSIAKVD